VARRRVIVAGAVIAAAAVAAAVWRAMRQPEPLLTPIALDAANVPIVPRSSRPAS
jgi:hypothetical protein